MLRTLGCFAACLTKATGGKMPADHETIRIWGLAGVPVRKISFYSVKFLVVVGLADRGRMGLMLSI